MSRVSRIRFLHLAEAGHKVWFTHRNKVLSGLPDGRHRAGATIGGALRIRDVPRGMSADEGAVVWELLSTNNRVLVRSALSFPTFVAAGDDARECAEAASSGGVRISYVIDRHAGGQGFMLSADSLLIATSQRWYSQTRKCTQAATAAVAALSVATFAMTAVEIPDDSTATHHHGRPARVD